MASGEVEDILFIHSMYCRVCQSSWCRKDVALAVDLPTAPLHALSEDGLSALFDDLARDSAVRERDRVVPHAAVRRLARAGLGTLRVPAADGGPDRSLRELTAVAIRLATADPAIAQALRAHFHFVESRRAAADPWERDRWFPEVLAGTLFGNATVERST